MNVKVESRDLKLALAFLAIGVVMGAGIAYRSPTALVDTRVVGGCVIQIDEPFAPLETNSFLIDK